MNLEGIVCLVSAAAVVVFGALNLIEARKTRRLVAALAPVSPAPGVAAPKADIVVDKITSSPNAARPREPAPGPRDERALVRPPAPPAAEIDATAPETSRKPGAPRSRRQAVAAPAPDLAALARELEAADRAQAGQAPELPPPVSDAPPEPDPAMVAAGLGKRPRPSLFGGLNAAAQERSRMAGRTMAPPKSAPLPIESARSDDFDADNEVTRLFDRPPTEAPPAPPRVVRAQHVTLPSMPSVAPPSARPAPSVDVVESRPAAETPAPAG